MFEEIQWGKLVTYLVGVVVAIALVVTATVFINRGFATLETPEDNPQSQTAQSDAPASVQPQSQASHAQSLPEESEQPQSAREVQDPYAKVSKEDIMNACKPGEEFLKAVFAHAEQEHTWDESTKSFMTPEAYSLLDELESRLIRKQDLAVPPGTVIQLSEDYPRLAYCEGASNLSGWLVTMEQSSPEDTWKVKDFQARNPELAFYPRRFLEESEQ